MAHPICGGFRSCGVAHRHLSGVRLNTALRFFKGSRPAEYEIVPLGVKKRTPLDDLALTAAILQYQIGLEFSLAGAV